MLLPAFKPMPDEENLDIFMPKLHSTISEVGQSFCERAEILRPQNKTLFVFKPGFIGIKILLETGSYIFNAHHWLYNASDRAWMFLWLGLT